MCALTPLRMIDLHVSLSILDLLSMMQRAFAVRFSRGRGWTLAIYRRTHTHTHTHPFNGPLSGTTRVSRYQNGKPIWILLKQETVSGSGISWAISKSGPRSSQITMPVPHHSVFLQAGCPSCRPTNSAKALKAI